MASKQISNFNDIEKQNIVHNDGIPIKNIPDMEINLVLEGDIANVMPNEGKEILKWFNENTDGYRWDTKKNNTLHFSNVRIPMDRDIPKYTDDEFIGRLEEFLKKDITKEKTTTNNENKIKKPTTTIIEEKPKVVANIEVVHPKAIEKTVPIPIPEKKEGIKNEKIQNPPTKPNTKKELVVKLEAGTTIGKNNAPVVVNATPIEKIGKPVGTEGGIDNNPYTQWLNSEEKKGKPEEMVKVVENNTITRETTTVKGTITNQKSKKTLTKPTTGSTPVKKPIQELPISTIPDNDSEKEYETNPFIQWISKNETIQKPVETNIVTPTTTNATYVNKERPVEGKAIETKKERPVEINSREVVMQNGNVENTTKQPSIKTVIEPEKNPTITVGGNKNSSVAETTPSTDQTNKLLMDIVKILGDNKDAISDLKSSMDKLANSILTKNNKILNH